MFLLDKNGLGRVAIMSAEKRAKPILGERIFLANHAPNLFDRALRAALIGDGLTTAILAVASTEAFTHDLINCLQYLEDHSENCLNRIGPSPFDRVFKRPVGICVSPLGHELSGCETMLLKELERCETERIAIPEKIRRILEIATKGAADRAIAQLEDFALLVTVRNELVHPKGERLTRRTKNGHGHGNIDGHARVVTRLVQRKLIQRPKDGVSWLNALDESFAKWCLRSASDTIKVVLEALPSSPLMDHFKRVADLGWAPA